MSTPSNPYLQSAFKKRSLPVDTPNLSSSGGAAKKSSPPNVTKPGTLQSFFSGSAKAAKRPKLLQDIFKLSKGGADFPMMTVSINFTQVAMQALRGGVLTKEANSTKALLEAFHAMHAACFLYFIKEWKRRGLGIADFGFLKKEIETLAQKKPAKLLAGLKAFDEGRSSQLDAIVESGKKKGEKEAKF